MKITNLAKSIQCRAEEKKFWPRHPRIPIYIELKDYAKWLADVKEDREPIGVLTYLARLIERRVQQPVAVGLLRRMLSQSRWAVVFDGLDEVPQDRRHTVAREVLSFVAETDAEADADVFFLCTSRPQGYSGQFDGLNGLTVELLPLSKDQALRCAEPVLAIDRTTEQQEAAISILREALDSGAVREIMTSPLQAHIMAVLVRDGRRPPDRKWKLYDSFYRVIFQREANRSLPDTRLRKLFEQHEKLLRAVHEALGFELHVRAERSEGAQASLGRGQFNALVERVVQAHVDHGAAELVETVTTATTERLVLVSTPDSGNQVRFDIRPLQEFFAAEFLYQHVEAETLRTRLHLLTGDAHWQEVLHFLLSALVENNRNTEISIAVEVLQQLDQGKDPAERELAQRDARGARLAARLLHNGVLEPDRRQRIRFRPCLDAMNSSLAVESLVPDPDYHPQSRHWLIDYLLQRFEETDFIISVGAAATLGTIIGSEQRYIDRFITKLSCAPLAYQGVILVKALRGLNYEIRHDEPQRFPQWCVELAASLLKNPLWYRLSRSSIAAAIEILTQTHSSQISQTGKLLGLGEAFTGLVGYLSTQFEDESVRSNSDDHEAYKVFPLNTSWGTILLRRAFPQDPDSDCVSLSRKLRSCTESPTGIFAVMASTIQFAASLRREDFISCLQDFQASGWWVSDFFSSRLNYVIPVFWKSIAPSELLQDIINLSNDEFASQWRSHNLAGHRPAHYFVMREFPADATKMTVEDFQRIAQLSPDVAVNLWVDPDPQIDLDSLMEGIGEVDVPKPWESRHPDTSTLDTVTEIFLNRPDLLIQHTKLWGAFWHILGPRSPNLRQKLRTAAVGETLHLWQRHDRIHPFTLALPAEEPLLIPICNMIYSDAWGRSGRSYRHENKLSDVYASLISQYVADAGKLLHSANDIKNSPAQRGAALLLAVLHAGAGINILTEYSQLLIELAARTECVGLPLFVGVCIEMNKVESILPMRSLLSALLKASVTDFEHRAEIDTLLALWRSRSLAPATQANVLNTWT